MMSLASRSFVFASLLVLPIVIAGTPKSCVNPQVSCQNTSAVGDLCCFNAPGGQLLQTQFWDTSPPTGPSNSWTIHGLWPDHCDGTFDSNCDPSRTHSDIAAILQSFGMTDVLSYMNTYWKDINGNDQTFWSHEWNTHGTCISTLNPSCYTGYASGEEVADFFQKTVSLFQGLDSYTALANAGIVPSSSATYTRAQIQAALRALHGFDVTLGCSSGALNQIWYSFDVQGSVQTGTFIPTAPGGTTSTCPSSGIRYLPKSTTTSSSAATTTTASVGVFSGSGYLNAYTSGTHTGCLISAGTWYVSGTCATYTATLSGSGFTLKSSKGPCGIVSSIFKCGSGVSASVFQAINSYLAINGQTQFYAPAVPSGQVQETVSISHNNVVVLFRWQSV